MFPKRNGFILFASTKRTKSSRRAATLWTPRDGSKLYRIFFSWHFRFSSLNRYMVRLAFSEVLNRCERVIAVQTQDRYFLKMGYCTTSSQGASRIQKGWLHVIFIAAEICFYGMLIKCFEVSQFFSICSKLWYADWKFWFKAKLSILPKILFYLKKPPIPTPP